VRKELFFVQLIKSRSSAYLTFVEIVVLLVSALQTGSAHSLGKLWADASLAHYCFFNV